MACAIKLCATQQLFTCVDDLLYERTILHSYALTVMQNYFKMMQECTPDMMLCSFN